MALDPHISGVLQMLANAGSKRSHEGTPDEARAGYLALTVGTRKPGQVVPVGSVQDAVVDGAAGPLKARIYRPEGTGPFPTVAYFHGGGFVIGDLETHDNMCRDICRGARAVVVSIDYRRAPEHPFPAGVDDALAATQWVLAHTADLGGSSVVGVAGDSAGGNFAAVVAQQLRDAGVALTAQFLIYPATDQARAAYPSVEENAKGYLLEAVTMQWYFDHYTNGFSIPVDPRLAPLWAENLGGLAPAVVVTAELDPLRDHGAAYVKALRAAGVKVDYIEGPGMVHGFFDMGRWSPAAQAITQDAIQRFGELLQGA
ncbi:MAG: alpha/beta hydrolase [Ottowia sp.]|uniref:alpha/beta hydrolase n=1 Tax=Ottowia sp. TaxID=1898956 RepID=UPI003C707826